MDVLCWQGLRGSGERYGSMLVKRAGVTVMVGSHQMNRNVATGSALYWAWQRRARPTVDLSMGGVTIRSGARTFAAIMSSATYCMTTWTASWNVADRPEIDRDVELELLRYRHGVC